MVASQSQAIAVFTSVPPRMSRTLAGQEVGADHQRQCVASWSALSATVVSVNPEGEAALVQATFPALQVVPVPTTNEALLSRPLLRLNDMLETAAASNAEVVVLLNADILIRNGKHVAELLRQVAPGKAVVAHRLDVTDPKLAEGEPCLLGLDLFALHRTDLLRLRSSVPLYVGAPWWDYHMLGELVLQGFEIGFLNSEHVIHLAHEGGWDKALWDGLGTAFGREFLTRASDRSRISRDPEAQAFAKTLHAFGTKVRRKQRPAWKAAIREALGKEQGKLGADDLDAFSRLFVGLAEQQAGQH